MNGRLSQLLALALAVCVAGTAVADQVAVIAPEEAVVERSFGVGDVLPIPLEIIAGGDAGLFGVDLDLSCASEDIRIAWVEYDPAFASGIERGEVEFPTQRLRLIRSQALGNLDRSLGADGRPVLLCTVGVEIVNGRPFESALEIRATGALIGRIPDATVVAVGDQQPHFAPIEASESDRTNLGRGRIPIINVRPPAPPPEIWDVDYDYLAMEVQPAGGGDPLEVLEPHTTYELHYDASTPEVAGYILSAIAMLPEESITDIRPPQQGPWSDTGLFFAQTDRGQPDHPSLAAPGFDPGYYKYAVAGDDVWPCDPTCAPPTGQLCTFTTGDEGEFNLQLAMYLDDPTTLSTVEMEAEARFEVFGGADRQR